MGWVEGDGEEMSVQSLKVSHFFAQINKIW